MVEYGRTGLRTQNGLIYDEMLPELTGMRGVKVYREMESNDAMVRAFLYAIEMLVRQTSWIVEPGGDSEADSEAAEFVESCMDDMETTWQDTISEVLSFLVYGWSLHEIVYKRRNGRTRKVGGSKYTDGLIGWKKLPGRAQDTLYQWEFDRDGELAAMIQEDPNTFEHLRIPVGKCLLFRTSTAKGNPEGRSVLRGAYRSWYFKRRLQEIEAIGVERDLAGLPVIRVPDEIRIWDPRDQEGQSINAALTNMVKNIRRNEFEGLVLPMSFDIQLLSTGGSRQFDTGSIIGRYNTEIAQTVLADFLMLGHEGTGSFALSEDKTKMFSIALGTYLDAVCEAFSNQAITKLIDINGDHFAGITDYPRLTHGSVDTADITKTSQYIKDMVGIGVIVPDEQLEDFVREMADLPERSRFEDERNADPRREAQRREPERAAGMTAAGGADDGGEPDPEAVEAAKRRLGIGW